MAGKKAAGENTKKAAGNAKASPTPGINLVNTSRD